ncbi:hypothetical protein SISSUDRAFT_1133631, partial [Sistotremastrum suecicum HHB10207 ss-3]
MSTKRINNTFDLTSLWSLFSVTPARHERSATIRCSQKLQSCAPLCTVADPFTKHPLASHSSLRLAKTCFHDTWL